MVRPAWRRPVVDANVGGNDMAGLGWQELLVVLVIVMIIFGAGKLPDIARSLGQGVKAFKQEATAPIGAGVDQPAQKTVVETETIGRG